MGKHHASQPLWIPILGSPTLIRVMTSVTRLIIFKLYAMFLQQVLIFPKLRSKILLGKLPPPLPGNGGQAGDTFNASLDTGRTGFLPVAPDFPLLT